MSESLRRIHAAAAASAEQAFSSAVAKRRGENRLIVDIPINLLSPSAPELSPQIGDAERRRRIRQEAESQEQVIVGAIQTALGPTNTRFTRKSPLAIRIIMGLGDPRDHEAAQVTDAMSNMRRVRQYMVDESGNEKLFLELFPLDIYCFKFESGAIGKITAYFRGLKPIKGSETMDVISSRVWEGDTPLGLINEIKTLESSLVSVGMQRDRALLRGLQIESFASFSGIRGEIMSEDEERTILSHLMRGTVTLDRYIDQSRRTNSRSEVLELPDIVLE